MLILFIPMLLAGLAISAHCVTMCGTMVLSYAIKDDIEGPFLTRMMPHVAYQGARAVSYVLVGLVLGAIGSAFDIAGIRPWVMVFAGVYMVLMGLSMTGRFPVLRYITPRPPEFMLNAVMKLRKRAKAEAEAGESTLLTPLMFGAITGLMPCGPLQSAQIAAAGAGSAAAGAFAMLGFWIGTMPLMLGFGAVSSLLSARFRKYMLVAGSIAIMVVGAIMLNRGATLAGSPVTFDSVKAYALGTSSAGGSQGFVTGKDGVAEVKLAIRNTQYVPQTVSIPAGRPVRLVVDREEDNSCSDQLALPQLGILKDLKAFGTTTVDIPATKAGSYTLTCGMGMMSGTLAVGGGAAAPSGRPVVLLLVVAAAGCLAVWAFRRPKKAAPAAKKPRAGASQSAPAGLFGFSSSELLLVGGSLAAAALIGLYLGGYFS